MSRKVGVISYQTGHLKTFQILLKLLSKSFQPTVYAFPFTPRPQSNDRFEDRPYQIIDFSIRHFCRNYGVRYVEVKGWEDQHAESLGIPEDPETPEIYLTCIAKIIPKSFIEGRSILNCHPGLLPQNRGVDAFKWSVVNEWPIGITLHIIDECIDRGMILRRMRIPILPGDDFKTVCKRAYDMELDLMANFDYYLDNQSFDWQVGDNYSLSHKRVPKNIDDDIENLFLEKRSKLIQLSRNRHFHAHPADRPRR